MRNVGSLAENIVGSAGGNKLRPFGSLTDDGQSNHKFFPLVFIVGKK